jgi:hypothetical protein
MLKISAVAPPAAKRRHTMRSPSGLKKGPPS